jgi:hypothetical protein
MANDLARREALTGFRWCFRSGSSDRCVDDREIDLRIEDVVDEVRQHELSAQRNDLDNVRIRKPRSANSLKIGLAGAE